MNTLAADLERRLRYRVARDPVARELRELASTAGAELRLVGGYVRDAALGLGSEDLDLAAGRGCARLVAALRSRWHTGGYRFRKRGVTTWRFRRAGRQLDLVDASRRGLDADLRRRELTVNAIAFDMLTGRLIDPLRGCVDLRLRRLNPPHESVFREDPVRALRVCRFLSQLPGFRLTRVAQQQAAAVARALRRAPAERVRQELDKLLAGTDPRLGLQMLARLGLRSAVLPELDALGCCVAGRDRPDVWTHTLDALALAASARRLPGAARVRPDEERLTLRWSLLLHDISKPETLAWDTETKPTFHGHEVLGQRRAEKLLRRLRAPSRRRRRVGHLVRLHLRPGHLADAGAPVRGLRRLVRDCGEDLPLLVVHAGCDARASGCPRAAARWRRMSRVLRSLLAIHDDSLSRPLPTLVDGRDVMRLLGLDPGPRIGRVLRRVRQLQEEGALRTRADALDYLREAD